MSMENISPLIKELATAVFPVVQRHAINSERLITFEVTDSEEEGDDAHKYTIHCTRDFTIQIRVDEGNQKAIILGMKGTHLHEVCLDNADDDEINIIVAGLVRSLRNS